MLRKIDHDEISDLRSDLEVFGFCLIQDAFELDGLVSLKSEVIGQFDNAHFTQSDEYPAFEAYIAERGPVCNKFLNGDSLASVMGFLTDHQYRMSEKQSCVTYYLEGGYLAPHLDNIDGEEGLSVISYIWADTGAEASDLYLDILGSQEQPNEQPLKRLKTSEGAVALGYGTRVWHARQTMQKGQKLIALTGSFHQVL